MSREWSPQSTSKLTHRTPRSLHLLASPPSLNTQATPEENSEVDNVGVGGADVWNVPDVDMTPRLSSTHSAGEPDPYYITSSYPPVPQSMYTERQSTDATTSDSHSRDRHAQYATLRLLVPHDSSISALPSASYPSSVGSAPPTVTAADFPPSTAGPGVPSYYSGAYVYRDSDLSLASASRSGLHSRASSGQQSGRIELALLPSYPRMGVNPDSQLDSAQPARAPSGGEVERLRFRRQQLPVLRPPRSPVYEESEVQSSPIRVQTSHLFNTTDPFHDLTDNEAASINHQKELESSEERYFNLLPPVIEPTDSTSPFRHSFQTHATAGSTHDGSSLPSSPTWRASAMPFSDQLHWAEVVQCIKTADNKPQAADSTNSNVDRLSVEAPLSMRDNMSPDASQSCFSNSQGRSNSSLVPPIPQGSISDGLLTSASITSGSDSFTAFELMSFPKPPAAVPSQQVPMTPSTRSPWVKGLTLPMPINTATYRRSTREPGTPTTLYSSSPPVPTVPVPPLPLSLASPSTLPTPLSVSGSKPTFHVVKTPSRVVVTTHDTPVPTVATPGIESWLSDPGFPSPPSRTSPPLWSKDHLGTPSVRASVDGSMTTNSKCCPLIRMSYMSHFTAGVALSYNRRLSALIHATEQLVRPSQDSAYEEDSQARVSEDADQLGTFDRPSEDDPAAVVGIVRIASLSWRSKALLTRAPSSGGLAAPPAIQVQHTAPPEGQSPIDNTVAPLKLKTEDSVLRQGVHTYLSTSPSPRSKAPSPSSTVTAASPSSSTPTTLKLSPSLRRQPPAREPGFFPESVVEVDDQPVLAHDVDRTGRGITSFDMRGVDTRMDRGSKDQMHTAVSLYDEKDLPPVPYPEPQDSSFHSRALPPLPLPPHPHPPFPTVPPPAILSDAGVQSQPDHRSDQLRRQESFGSDTLTRVSSLLSRLSKSSMPSTPTNTSRHSMRKCRRGTVMPPPLPPPPLPLPLTPKQMQLPRIRGPHPYVGMVNHELMERAATLERIPQDNAPLWQSWNQCRSQMPLPTPNLPLDEAYLYHQHIPQQQAQSSSGKGYVHKKALSKASSIRSMFSTRSDRSKYRSPNHVALGVGGANASTSGDGGGWFTQLDDDGKRKRLWQIRALGVDSRRPQKVELDPGVGSRNTGGPPQRKQWTSRSKWFAVILLVLALIGLVVGLAVILTRSTSNTQAASCTGSNTTGRFCDIGTFYLAPLCSSTGN